MVLSPGDFAGFVRANLEKARRIGVELGADFNNIAFFNALRDAFPTLNAAQVGALLSTVIAAAKAGREQEQLDPNDVLSPDGVPINPGLIGVDPGDLTFQYSVLIAFTDEVTGRTHFRPEIIVSAHPLSPNDLMARAFEALQELLDESPPDDDAEPRVGGGIRVIVNLVLRHL